MASRKTSTTSRLRAAASSARISECSDRRSMTRYLVRRLLGTVPVFLLITLLVFLLLHAAPGDPAALLLSDATSEADVIEARQRWGLDQPLHIQYWKFLAAAVTGDLGKSFRLAQPVSELIAVRLPATIELATFSILIAVTLAIPLGVWSGAKPNSWVDNLGTSFGLFGISMPNFWLGIMLILLLAGSFHILPSAGRSTDRKSTRLNSSHSQISYAVFCLKK